MFSKKQHVDTKKSIQKITDFKRDSASRLKHLRNLLDNLDVTEAKSFFEEYYSHIYYIFYDVFISIEANVKQRGHKIHKEDFETIQYTLEKIFVFLPELLHRRWQSHSLQRISKRLLHPGNSTRVRREGIRLFLLWYQILGDQAGPELDALYCSIVPGLVPGLPSPFVSGSDSQSLHGSEASSLDSENSVFYSPTIHDIGPVWAGDISPLMPPSGVEQPQENATRHFLECLLEFMVTQVQKIEWRDKSASKQQKCFEFLFEKFKKFYLPFIFPNYSFHMSIFNPDIGLPQLRTEPPNDSQESKKQQNQKEFLMNCQAIVVKWVASFSHCPKKPEGLLPVLSSGSDRGETNSEKHVTLVGPEGDPNFLGREGEQDPYLANNNRYKEHLLISNALYSTRENVNLIHEVFRQAFMMSFSQSGAMRKVIAVYKDWIYKNLPEMPKFLEEPHEGEKQIVTDVTEEIPRTEENIRAGLQNMLHVFITNAANVFLLEVTPENLYMLEEQVEMCKRVLNIYRYMVMNIKMERKTWEQMLKVMLQITSLVLKEVPPPKKEETLGGRLAPALFQTLIVTWIKANLNVIISTELWNQFLQTLSSLTRWEELIKEWAKTMDTLTRVLARHVYALDLNDLPLNRPTEQKEKRTRGKMNIPRSSVRTSPGHHLHHLAGQKNSAATHAVGSEGPVGSLDVQNQDFSKSHQIRDRCNSGDSAIHQHQLLNAISRQTSLHRSNSDSSIFMRKCVDDEHTEIMASAEFYIQELQRQHSTLKSRSKSVDYINRADSPCLSESFEYRSRSPSPTASSGVESSSIKDSPLQIDVMVSSADNSCNNSDIVNAGDMCSVMAGGTIKGWHPDVAVVLWKRMLGALGDINHIPDPVIHAQVLEFLLELAQTLIKIRNNMGITVDNMSSPSPPELIPPFHLFAPWLFKAISLPETFQRGRLLAYQLLCLLTLRRQDIPLCQDYMAHFYLLLHQALIGNDQSVVNTVVQYCGSQFFSADIPGSTLLLMDFIHAANTIVSSPEVKGVPRTEAMTILGSILCIPSVCEDLSVLQLTNVEPVSVPCHDAKDHIINLLIKAGKREPVGTARCIAICSLGMFVYGELLLKTNHPRVGEAINVMLAALKFNSRAVAQVASEMLLLQCHHTKYLLQDHPEIPKKIVQVIASTLTSLLPSANEPLSEDEKKLLLSLIFCLGEWCINISQALLSQKDRDNKPILLSVFRVLNSIVTGVSETSTLCTAHSIGDLAGPDVDPNITVDNLQERSPQKVPSPHRQLPAISMSPEAQSHHVPSFMSHTLLRSSIMHLDPKSGLNIVRLAARTVMGHLVNYLGHFPLGLGASHLTSLVNENDDLSLGEPPSNQQGEISSGVFQSPNVQCFVLNSCTILSLIQIPAPDVPGGGATAGLTTAPWHVRVIIRDQSGKFCWDCSPLYGPPGCFEGSSLPTPSLPQSTATTTTTTTTTTVTTNLTQAPSLTSAPYPRVSRGSTLVPPSGNSPNLSTKTKSKRLPDELPTLENSRPDMDNLNELLEYIGHTSSECVPRRGNPLNCAPQTSQLEADTVDSIINQRNSEETYVEKYGRHPSVVPKPVHPPGFLGSQSEFQHCRILLNQLGFMSWEKRPHFDLLKKNEKLLRELRNLDKEKCRETHKIAVIYVGEGQEDKNSVLLNTCGSPAFEAFVAGLGWEVDLETHVGFMGGLQRNGSTGLTAPYYATSFVEVIFHVATRMTSDVDEDSLLKKLRHLGNDEVHIVWSDHSREYRRGIIATEFCDVLIVIYPIKNQLYRIQITRKPEIPFSGPLFDGAIVSEKLLPGLVRATAINASMAKRSVISLSQKFFEERAGLLETIVKNHKDTTTFEQFAASVYAPSSSSRPLRTGRAMFDETALRPSSSNNLAAALLDSPHTTSHHGSPILHLLPGEHSPVVGGRIGSSPQAPARVHKARERPLSASHSHSSSPLSQH